MASASRVAEVLERIRDLPLLVVGDVMLDCFLFGEVSRISPEAPVPVLRYQRESFMPGGAANIACNLVALGAKPSILGMTGVDSEGETLRELLEREGVDARHLLSSAGQRTGIKTRIVARQQQIVRVDREEPREPGEKEEAWLRDRIDESLPTTAAVIVGDYGKGMVSPTLLSHLKEGCRRHKKWLSMDPKPVHRVDLGQLSLLTPNRGEAFELTGIGDRTRNTDPLKDRNLMETAGVLQEGFEPEVLLITLGELGMLLLVRDEAPVHVPTSSREVYDVSGAGDTVIAAFTLAMAAGFDYRTAAEFSNQAAAVVVGKRGTATATPAELLAHCALP